MEAVGNLSTTAWLLIGAALVLGLSVSWLWRWYRQRRARNALIQTMSSAAADALVDVFVPDGMGGFFHCDFLLLSPRGIFIVDLRDVRGNIFGGDQMTEWTVMDRPQRYTFPNPLGGLYDRVAAVKALAGDVAVEGRVVFTRRGKFPKGLPKWTLMLDTLREDFPGAQEPWPTGSLEHDELLEGWRRLKSSVQPSRLSHTLPVESA